MLFWLQELLRLYNFSWIKLLLSCSINSAEAKLFIERKDNSIINQNEIDGGVAQLVRARDS